MFNSHRQNEKLFSNVYKGEGACHGSFAFWLAGIIVLIAVDQYVKWLAFNRPVFQFLDSLRPVVGFERFYNHQFAFSLPLPEWLMFTIYVIGGVLIVKHIMHNFASLQKIEYMAWMLICAGGLSNIVERIVLGHVRDFVYIASGIFNFADFFIIFGILLLIFVPRARAI
jgi:lipoprotein signal peptidase